MQLANFNGIVSNLLDDITPIEITKGVSQYILWKNNDGKLTAIYKFEKNSKLPFLDEHIFVISGVFNDGNKKYKEGSFIINPKGTSHIPQSEEGCTYFSNK
ncbi:cupin domain-containing protein [Aliarcobacter butzleri]|uniref:cupin domain-containing protein n=1 Tax=Aliarcobacter butzleri TaxID=28197 RepID=UPI0021B2BD5B|nr:cupin domain-containing protein [Aliarcobacter butzleri]MCT7635036.1 cupin domain-containing protein [Aliarcobacter butzleri]